MAKIDLNKIYDFRIESPYTLKKVDREILSANPPSVKEDWDASCYEVIKQAIKKNYIKKQKDRCAYCRNWVEADGKYEPMEHIVAKSIRPRWMFKVANLVITCDSCNNLKGFQPTLSPDYDRWINFPSKGDAFVIFNPHFEKWSDHFKIIDEIFLVAKRNSKGDDTIRICKLGRYQVTINNARMKQMTERKSAKAITQRLYVIGPASREYEELEKALNYYEQRIPK